MDLMSPAFWGALGSIVLANILLSGDNAVVIALAARSLPPHQQKRAIVGGSVAAIVMRIALTLVAAEMLTWPYLKLVGGLLLLYVGVTLMLEDDNGEDGRLQHADGLIGAIRTILIADLVMSLDNVLAVAAAAKGDTLLLSLGLAISIPLIVFGSTMLLRVMERLPLLITLGAALLGYLAGDMMASDEGLARWTGPVPQPATIAAGVAGAVLVVLLGARLQRRSPGIGDDR